MIARLWRSTDAWLKENASMIALGSALAVTFALWDTRTAVNNANRLHAQDCSNLRERFIDVADFWNAKATTHGTHSGHEHDAGQLWLRITGELPRNASAALTSDIAHVASTWQGLADDDASEARLDSTYVQLLARDFTASCGSAPTPDPMIPEPSSAPKGKP